jgi:hypothetical protein
MKKKYLIFTGFVLVSCEGEVKNVESQPSTSSTAGVEISTLVLDLSTSVGNQPLGIRLRSASEDFMKRIGVQLENELELRTYPQLEIVPTSKTTTISHHPREGIPYEGKILLNHVAPLEDRWYVIIVKKIPVSQEGWIEKHPLNLVGHSVSQLGDMVARFHPASQPVIQQIRYCKPTSMNVTFSETIPFSGPEIDAEMPMFLRVGDSVCMSDKPGGDGSREDFSFTCPYQENELETKGISFELKQNKFGIHWFDGSAKTGEELLKQQVSLKMQKTEMVTNGAVGNGCWAYVP